MKSEYEKYDIYMSYASKQHNMSIWSYLFGSPQGPKEPQRNNQNNQKDWWMTLDDLSADPKIQPGHTTHFKISLLSAMLMLEERE